MRLLAVVQYDGTSYAGWQIQPDQISVQETIERSISQIRNTPTKIFGSGRTDAGVHAFGQTFHFDIEEERDLEKFRYSINAVLPKDIHLLSLNKVNDDFHARLSAKKKTYQYLINNGEYDVFRSPFESRVEGKLDLLEMEKAAKVFEGTHSFQNFTTKEEDEDNFVRTIYVAQVSNFNDRIYISFTGNGFMRYMVRLMVGAIIQVGKGKMSIQDIQRMLDSKERQPVGYKAESKGLSLVEVKYN